MVVNNSGTGSPGVASDRAALRTLGERRRRVVRSIGTVVVVTLAMLVLATLNRDQQSVDACHRRVEFMVKAFQEHYDKRRSSPSELPLPPGDSAARDHYLYNWRFTESYQPEVGVCCCRWPHVRLFQPSRRYVVIFDNESKTYRLEWMKESDFARQADTFGLRVHMQP